MRLDLPASAAAWGSEAFAVTLSQELAALGPHALPLQQGLSRTSHVTDAPIQVRVIAAREAEGWIRVRIGVFFAGVIGGCSCADDPTPVQAQTEYCELGLTIDRHTGQTQVSPLED